MHCGFPAAYHPCEPMNNIEIIIALLLLFMAVPDACQKLQRPALAYPVFICFGLLVAPFLDGEVVTMLKQAGQVGFLLLLFEVGLEIDLPKFREFLPPLKQAALWAALQCPVALLLAWQAGLDGMQSVLAAAALTGCSVGMAHSAWKGFAFAPDSARSFTLHLMVALELISIVVLAVGTTALKDGLNWWIAVRLLGILAVVILLARYAAHLVAVFQNIIEKTTHWRLHWLVLLVLAICALGQRLGLDAAKTAFVLGLCMSRARHDGMNIEEFMAPLSRRFLIPIFFVALGMSIPWAALASRVALLAAGTAGLLLGLREILQRRWFPAVGKGPVFLLVSPSLTLVALAANALLAHGQASEAATWLLLAGLFVTVGALTLLPARSAPPPTLRP